MTLPLTAKQEQLWRYIKSCKRSPSYTEMAMALYGHHNAKGRINNLVCALKERGFVDYVPSRARTIVALDPPTKASAIPTSALLLELTRRGIGLTMLPLQGRIS
jgi:SOS-response transcriptional repressor LexA